MRTFLVLVLTLVMLCAVDLLGFQGQHTKAVWQETKLHAQKLWTDLDYQLRKLGWK